ASGEVLIEILNALLVPGRQLTTNLGQPEVRGHDRLPVAGFVRQTEGMADLVRENREEIRRSVIAGIQEPPFVRVQMRLPSQRRMRWTVAMTEHAAGAAIEAAIGHVIAVIAATECDEDVGLTDRSLYEV